MQDTRGSLVSPSKAIRVATLASGRGQEAGQHGDGRVRRTRPFRPWNGGRSQNRDQEEHCLKWQGQLFVDKVIARVCSRSSTSSTLVVCGASSTPSRHSRDTPWPHRALSGCSLGPGSSLRRLRMVATITEVPEGGGNWGSAASWVNPATPPLIWKSPDVAGWLLLPFRCELFALICFFSKPIPPWNRTYVRSHSAPWVSNHSMSPYRDDPSLETHLDDAWRGHGVPPNDQRVWMRLLTPPTLNLLKHKNEHHVLSLSQQTAYHENLHKRPLKTESFRGSLITLKVIYLSDILAVHCGSCSLARSPQLTLPILWRRSWKRLLRTLIYVKPANI